MENKLHSTVTLNLGGEDRKIKFTITAVEELEALLTDKNGKGNAFLLMTKDFWSVTEIIAALYCGLKVFDRKLAKATVESWVEEYCEDKQIMELRLYVMSALGLSGIVVQNKSAFADILNGLNDKKKSEEYEEEELGK